MSDKLKQTIDQVPAARKLNQYRTAVQLASHQAKHYGDDAMALVYDELLHTLDRMTPQDLQNIHARK